MASSPLFLGLDSATPFLSLALWSPAHGGLAESRLELGRAHAERILEELEALFARAGATPADLDGIGVGTGPGSYTGLRVGIATARGLARGLGVALAGGDSLAALAAAGLSDGEEGLAVLDARRGNLYAGRYRREGTDVATLEPPRKVARTTLLGEHPSLRLIEGIAPDATVLARGVPRGEPPTPRYL